jgi:putative DNA primase/helicase
MDIWTKVATGYRFCPNTHFVQASRADLMPLRLALAGRTAELAIALLGEPNRAISGRRELRFGRHGSLAVVIAGSKAGLWHDHESGRGGDMLSLIMRERGGDFLQAVELAERFIGHASPHAQRVSPTSKQQTSHEPDDAERTRKSMNVWDSAGRIGGPALRYLHSRAIADAIRDDGEVLRFHPRCPFSGFDGEHVPALVALFRDLHSNQPVAIHRRPLSAAGEKLGHWKAWGPTSNAAIKLSDDPEIAHHLTVGEGIETTLSGIMLGYAPAWAIGSAGGLRTFPVLAGIESLTILVDNDRNRTGQDAAVACSARWTNARREVFRFVPRCPGADVNDLLLVEAASA